MEEADCVTQCYQELDGNGVRRKREVSHDKLGKTEGWEENLELRVTLPDDKKMTSSPDPSECRLFLIVTLATALTFCLLSACIVVFACYRRYAETRRKNKGCDNASIKSGSSAGFKSRTDDTQGPIQVIEKVIFHLSMLYRLYQKQLTDSGKLITRSKFAMGF